MTEKRYQVFISSTFEDLEEERKAAYDAILNAGDFPAGMEIFPAADADQFDYIKTIIDQSDYYIVVVGGRYGSLTDDGISYTEKEYRYAKSKNVPVLAIIHKDREAIAVGKAEASDDGRAKLQKFIAELSKGRIITGWKNAYELKYEVLAALNNAKKTTPRLGWVRGNAVASFELLTEVNELRKENSELRKGNIELQALTAQDTIENLHLDFRLPDLPDLDDTITINVYSGQTPSKFGEITGTWLDFFPFFYNGIIGSWYSDPNFDPDYRYREEDFSRAFAFHLCLATFSEADTWSSISDQDQTALTSYYQEIGFMTFDGPNPFSTKAQQVHRRISIHSKTESDGGTLKGIRSPTVTEDTKEIPF